MIVALQECCEDKKGQCVLYKLKSVLHCFIFLFSPVNVPINPPWGIGCSGHGEADSLFWQLEGIWKLLLEDNSEGITS